MDAELARLRRENAALIQLIEKLEKEGADLASRLAEFGGSDAKTESKRRQLTLQRQLIDAEKRLEMLQKHEGSSDAAPYEYNRDELIECLQRELVKMEGRRSENEIALKELNARMSNLEQDKKRLHEFKVDDSVAHLQEELIAMKLREAEASLSVKELEQILSELSDSYAKHVADRKHERVQSGVSVLSTPKKIMKAAFDHNRHADAERLDEELTAARNRAVDTLTEVEQLKSKIDQLTVQVQVTTDQLQRQDEEKKEIKESSDTMQNKVKTLMNQLKEQEKQYIDRMTKYEYEEMLCDVKFNENKQHISKLEQKLAALKAQERSTSETSSQRAENNAN